MTLDDLRAAIASPRFDSLSGAETAALAAVLDLAEHVAARHGESAYLCDTCQAVREMRAALDAAGRGVAATPQTEARRG